MAWVQRQSWIIFLIISGFAYVLVTRMSDSGSSFPGGALRTPYDEQVIVDLFNELYRLLLQLSYFPPWQVAFPLPEGHAINEDLCRELHISPEVISLMKRLPYPFDGYHKPVFWQSRAFEYNRDQEILKGRDPEKADTGTDEELRLDYLLPHEISLTCWMDDGISVILDAKESKFVPNIDSFFHIV
jgi:hypothetical protein